MTVADGLKRLMGRYKVSQSDVAELAGMEKQQVQALLSGKPPNPGILTVERVVEAIGGTMAEFYEGR